MLYLSDDFLASATCQNPVAGLTHDFYRYPARFSPQFIRTAIDTFTEPGDLILDPFMGGGTALVEAICRGRRAVGADINSLALFVSRVKTSALTPDQETLILDWAKRLATKNLRSLAVEGHEWRNHQQFRNLRSRKTWAIRDSIGHATSSISRLPHRSVKDFARCVVLRTAQWAIDGRRRFPTATEFRQQLWKNAEDMIAGNGILRSALQQRSLTPRLLRLRADQLSQSDILEKQGPPKLILTSPPYPGVHVLYHRWQLEGGLETPIPFWISECEDGHGESYYTFGHRSSHSNGAYFLHLEKSFKALAEIAGPDTIFVQVVGFSNPRSFLPRYLATLSRAGLCELAVSWNGQRTKRLWRKIPNRKWYNWTKKEMGSAREVVLFHRKGASRS